MKAVVWMLGAMISFSLMAVGGRELSGELSVFQTLFIRSVLGLLCITLVITFSSEKGLIRTQKFSLHVFRNIFHFAGQYGWFIGIGLLPMAEVFALEFTTPVWTLIIAALFLGEKITRRKIISICFGLLGVLIIVQPGYAIVDIASLIVLGAAVTFAISYSATKYLSASEKPITILFYMCVIQLPIGLIMSVEEWVNPVGIQWLWLSVVGLAALSAHYCTIKAMQHAEVTTIATLDFLRLPFIAVLGIFLYAEAFELALIIGGALMLLGNLFNIKGFLSRKKSSSD
ncbi:MAG: DMT family transporter [Pseudomonadales bacterium]|nr:DMT family transporter [Pseudomonadales bacterium]